MRPNRYNRVLMIIFALLLLGAGGGLHHHLLTKQTMHPAPSSTFPLELASTPPPPSVTLIPVFMGGFRGLLSDALWIRASILQEQGRYHELVQLAEWITILEPHYPQVWILQAWNMAYNMSVLMPTPDSRWQWIMHGLRLLRDRALQATAHSPEIAYEIALLFQHKISGRADDAGNDFKHAWMQHMQRFIDEDGSHRAGIAPMAEAMKMDAALISELDALYGEADFRLPAWHSIYWAQASLASSPSKATAIQSQRLIYQSMMDIFEKGNVTESRRDGVIVLSPAFEHLPGVITAFEKAFEDDPTVHAAFEKWLSRATRILVFYMKEEEALKLFERLHRDYPSSATSQGFSAYTKMPQPLLPVILHKEAP